MIRVINLREKLLRSKASEFYSQKTKKTDLMQNFVLFELIKAESIHPRLTTMCDHINHISLQKFFRS